MEEYHIERSKRTCHVTGKNFDVGDSYISCVVDSDGEFIRQDFDPEAWQDSRPEHYFAQWETEVPDPKKPKLIVNDEVLLEFFNKLEGAEEINKIEFRYLLALMLMRKRVLRFDDMRFEGETAYMDVTLRGGGQTVVVDPGLSEDKIANLQKELNAVFTIDFVEPEPPSCAMLSCFDVTKGKGLVELCAQETKTKLIAIDAVNGDGGLITSIEEAESLRDYAKEHKINIGAYLADMDLLHTSNVRDAFNQWLMLTKSSGATRLVLNALLDEGQDPGDAVNLLAKKVRPLSKRAGKYKVTLLVNAPGFFGSLPALRTLRELLGDDMPQMVLPVGQYEAAQQRDVLEILNGHIAMVEHAFGSDVLDETLTGLIKDLRILSQQAQGEAPIPWLCRLGEDTQKARVLAWLPSIERQMQACHEIKLSAADRADASAASNEEAIEEVDDVDKVSASQPDGQSASQSDGSDESSLAETLREEALAVEELEEN